MTTKMSARLARVCVATAVALSALATLPAAAMERGPAASRTLRAGPPGRLSFVRPEPVPPGAAPKAAAATFRVTYRGFTAAARAAFQRAVDLWAQRIDSPVTITVSANFQPLGAGVLGSAGPGTVLRDFPGAPRPRTWYVEALANKLAGEQLDPSLPDIFADFNSSFSNWHYGSGPAPSGKFDFTTVVLHELGHGLGFLGAGEVSGSRGTVRLVGFPIIYDRYTETGDNRSLLDDFPDDSAALARQLRGNRLFFDSPRVRAVNRNYRARLYAPASFDPGSSYSHLDETQYGKGDPNSLMTPFLSPGETIRKPGPITLAIFDTFGW